MSDIQNFIHNFTAIKQELRCNLRTFYKIGVKSENNEGKYFND